MGAGVGLMPLGHTTSCGDPMPLTTRPILARLMAILMLPAASVSQAGPFEDAQAARQRGDFATAFNQFRSMAAGGDASAQFELSLLYLNGQGVRQDAKESMYLLKLASVHGHTSAQSNLGVAFNRGRFLPQDGVKAYIWSSMAADSGDRVAKTNRDVVVSTLNPQQLELAKNLALQCKQRLSEVQKLPQCL